MLHVKIALICSALSVSTMSLAQNPTITANNAFALDYYYMVAKESPNNVVISPFSISTVMAMVYPGARNNTALQMQTAMGFSAKLENHNQDFKSILEKIQTKDSPLLISNRLWLPQDENVSQKFIEMNTMFFGASVKSMNFRTEPEQCRITINQTIQTDTKDLIKDLLPPESINTSTSMVLTNAIYFKDVWSKPFDEARTKPGIFTVAGFNIERIFMETDGTFMYFEDEVVSALELPYSKEFTMLFLLPKKDISTLHRHLTADYYASLFLDRAAFKKIQIPKFSISQEFDPIPTLQAFGLTDLFSDGYSDLSGIVSGYYVDNIFHKAFIDVNEKGTTAAAATAVIMEPRSMVSRAPDFIANKPFVFILRHWKSGSIIFIGKVEDPQPEN